MQQHSPPSPLLPPAHLADAVDRHVHVPAFLKPIYSEVPLTTLAPAPSFVGMINVQAAGEQRAYEPPALSLDEAPAPTMISATSYSSMTEPPGSALISPSHTFHDPSYSPSDASDLHSRSTSRISDSEKKFDGSLKVVAAPRRGLLLLLSPMIPSAAALESSPWRILVFHMQEMSVLLNAQTALPTFQTLLAIASGASAAPSGLLVAFDCLKIVGTRSEGMVGAYSSTTVWRHLCCHSRAGMPAKARSSDVELHRQGSGSVQVASYPDLSGSNSMGTASCAQDNNMWLRAKHDSHYPNLFLWYWKSSARFQGMLLSTLYLVAYPCAQMSFALLSCTDTRSTEAHVTQYRCKHAACHPRPPL